MIRDLRSKAHVVSMGNGTKVLPRWDSIARHREFREKLAQPSPDGQRDLVTTLEGYPRDPSPGFT